MLKKSCIVDTSFVLLISRRNLGKKYSKPYVGVTSDHIRDIL